MKLSEMKNQVFSLEQEKYLMFPLHYIVSEHQGTQHKTDVVCRDTKTESLHLFSKEAEVNYDLQKR